MRTFADATGRLSSVLVALSLASAAAAPPDPSAPTRPPVRGVTVSTPWAGQDWGSDEMVETLRTLRDLGVNWVAIHPYGGIANDGTVGGSRIDRLYEDPVWLTRPIREAHALGMQIFIKPHLAYWGSRFSWRGEIRFEDPAERERFFRTYEEWIVRVARLSAGADGFAVGTELDAMTDDPAAWRRIIAAVREEYDGPLTYCAGWDRFEEIPFWSDLDVIGVQSYFPLVEHEGIPTTEELEAGWRVVARRLEAFSLRLKRPIVLSELGYNCSRFAAVRPWDYEQHADAAAEDLQQRCLDVALTTLAESPHVVGAFLWKWFPGERARGDFRLSNPALRTVIRRHWNEARTAESR
ncbi:MAG: hypothetical protein R3B81_15905 [bacterium]